MNRYIVLLISSDGNAWRADMTGYFDEIGTLANQVAVYHNGIMEKQGFKEEYEVIASLPEEQQRDWVTAQSAMVELLNPIGTEDREELKLIYLEKLRHYVHTWVNPPAPRPWWRRFYLEYVDFGVFSLPLPRFADK